MCECMFCKLIFLPLDTSERDPCRVITTRLMLFTCELKPVAHMKFR